MKNNHLEAALFQRTAAIVQLEFPEFVPCPSDTCQQVTLEKHWKHMTTCKQLKSKGIKKIYMCQFHKSHVFKTYQDRDKHEHTCILLQYNDLLFQKQKDFDQGDVNFLIIENGSEHGKQAQMPYKMLQEWERKKELKYREEEKQKKQEQNLKEILYTTISDFTIKNKSNKQYQYTVKAYNLNFLYVLRIDIPIINYQKQYENEQDQIQNDQELEQIPNCTVNIENVSFIDESPLILDIFKEIKTQKDFNKLCVAQFAVFRDLQDKDFKLKSLLTCEENNNIVFPHPLRVGITLKDYNEQQDTGTIQILVHRTNLRIHKFIKSDYALLKIQKGNINQSADPYQKKQEAQLYQQVIASTEFQAKYREAEQVQAAKELIKNLNQQLKEKKRIVESRDKMNFREYNQNLQVSKLEFDGFIDEKQKIEDDFNEIQSENMKLPIQIQQQQLSFDEQNDQLGNMHFDFLDQYKQFRDVEAHKCHENMIKTINDHYSSQENKILYDQQNELKTKIQNLQYSLKEKSEKQKKIDYNLQNAQKKTQRILQQDQKDKQELELLKKKEEELQNEELTSDKVSVQQERDKRYCKMCRKCPAKIVFKPCGHLLYCIQCYKLCVQTNVDLRFCHICGQISTNKVNLNSNI